MKMLSLFSGVGGFDLGFEQAGFELVGMCEADPWCQKVLARHWPQVSVHPDVRTLKGSDYPNVDVVTGGFPCQDLSVAGNRAGLSGERSGLFFEFIRIVSEIREASNNEYPKFLVFENVPGLLNSNAGRDFAVVLSELAKLRPHDTSWKILDSRHFGVAQRRRRVFLVSDFAGERTQQILSLSQGVRRDTQASRETGKGVAACLTTGTGRRFDAETETLIPTPYSPSGFGAWREGVGTLLSSQGGVSGGKGTILAEPVALDSKASVSRSMNPSPLSPAQGARGKIAVACYDDPRRYDTKFHGGGDHGDMHPTLETRNPKQIVVTPCPEKRNYVATIQHASIGRKDSAGPQGKGWRDDGLSFTLDAMGSADAVATPYAVRRLTPTEVERLQGFPDSWTALTADGKTIPDTHRYRMCGNAITVPVGKWLAERILNARI